MTAAVADDGVDRCVAAVVAGTDDCPIGAVAPTIFVFVAGKTDR